MRLTWVIACQLASLTASTACWAEPQFLLVPNPLIKPASRFGTAKDTKDNKGAAEGRTPEAAGIPTAKRIDPEAKQNHDASVLSSPLPDALSPRASQAGGGPTTVDNTVRDTLAGFTVTAVLGNVAVLRTQVGSAGAVTSAGAQALGTGMQPSGTGSAENRQGTKQQVIRVRSGQPISIAGVPVIPTVTANQVDFSLAGTTGVIFTAPLESLSPGNFALPAMLKEPADAGTASRVTPTPTGTTRASSQVGGNTSSSSGYNSAPAGNSQR
jgi:hypothetical protein